MLNRLIMMMGTASKTYATWNPSDKNANLTLSNGDLTVTGTTVGWCSARATIGKSTGKWYWEVHFDSGLTYLMLGVLTSSMTTANGNYVGIDTTGFGYLNGGTGQKYTNATGSAYAATTYAAGDTIGVALDMDGGTIAMLKNNAALGTMFSGLSGTFFPGVSHEGSGGNQVTTANFGATALTYSPPAGFNAGLYS